MAGYPIETIQWERDGQTLPVNRRQRVYTNGTLIIEQTQRTEDAGTYTCQASNRQRNTARRDVEVQILGKKLHRKDQNHNKLLEYLHICVFWNLLLDVRRFL